MTPLGMSGSLSPEPWERRGLCAELSLFSHGRKVRLCAELSLFSHGKRGRSMRRGLLSSPEVCREVYAQSVHLSYLRVVYASLCAQQWCICLLCAQRWVYRPPCDQRWYTGPLGPTVGVPC